MRKKYSLNLDFARDIRAQRNIVIKEQDSITLHFSIFDDGVPVVLEGHNVRLFIKKSDGTMLYQLDNYTVDAHNVVFNINRQATTCPGLCYGELEFIKEDNEEYITTKSFVYKVDSKVVDVKGAIESVDDSYFLKEVEKFIAQAKIDIAEYREIVANIEAQIKEANGSLDKLHKDLEDADLTLNESKNNALEEIAQTKNNYLEEMSQTKNESLEEIEDTKDDCIEELTEYNDIIHQAITMLKNVTVTEITNLKKSSLGEMTTLKDNSLNEITGLTNESKETIKTLRDEVINNIDNYATEHIEELESIIESLIPTVGEARELETSLINLKESLTTLKDALQKLNADSLLLNDKLEVAVQMARTTQNELLTTKNEAVSVKVALNQVIEATESLKNALITENERAEANIDELNVLHPEADKKIVELRDLIKQAIDIAIPALKAYIAEFTPAEDLTEVNERLEALTNAINETYSILTNHHHDTLYGASKKQGFFGDNIYMFEKNSIMAGHQPPEWIIDHKSCIQFSTYKSNNTEFYSVYFKEDLNEPDTEVYVSLQNDVLTIHNGVLNQNYHAMRGNGGGQTKETSFTLLGTSKLYTLDFPLWNTNKESIVVQSPKASGLTNFDDANIAGYYTIDLPLSTFQQIANAPLLIANKDVKGVLEVKQIGANVMQTLTIHSLGQVFARLAGQPWERIDGGTASENTMTIGASKGDTLPAGISTMPKNPYFWDSNTGYVVFQATPTLLYVVYTYNAPLKAYYSGGTSFYINHSENKTQGFKYTNGKWISTLNGTGSMDIGGVSVFKADFKILACSHPVYTSRNYDTVYCDTKAIDYSVLPTLQNFRDISKTGKYYVEINKGDNIAYAPYTQTEELVVAMTDEELAYDSNDDGLLEPSDLERMPQAIPTDNILYRTKPRAITTRDIKGYVDAVVKASGEKHLTFYEDNGDVLRMTYNGSEWTDWKSIGGQEIDLTPYATIEHLEENYYNKNAIDKKISDIDIDTYKGEVGCNNDIYVASPAGFDKAFKEMMENKTYLNLWANIKGDVIGCIKGNLGRMTSNTSSATRAPGALLITDYNNLTDNFNFLISNSDKERDFDIIKPRNNTSILSGSNKGYVCYPVFYDAENSVFIKGIQASSSYFYSIDNYYYSDFNIYDVNEDLISPASSSDAVPKIKDFNNCLIEGNYKVDIKTGDDIQNAPFETTTTEDGSVVIADDFSGILEVNKAKEFIDQTLKDVNGNTSYSRRFNRASWSNWEKNVKQSDLEVFKDLSIPVPDKVQTITYTNGDKMPEVYNWVDLNGFKIMWINVKHSEAEYNSGVNGAMMKTLNFPEEAQIFNNIIMANITSYNRDNNTSTLSRVVQNVEIINNISVRGRWRHTDNNPPKIDRFTIMCFGF